MSGYGRRRKFSRQFKADIVKQMLRGTSVARLPKGHSIKPGCCTAGATRLSEGWRRRWSGTQQQRKTRKLEREAGCARSL